MSTLGKCNACDLDTTEVRQRSKRRAWRKEKVADVAMREKEQYNTLETTGPGAADELTGSGEGGGGGSRCCELGASPTPMCVFFFMKLDSQKIGWKDIDLVRF